MLRGAPVVWGRAWDALMKAFSGSDSFDIATGSCETDQDTRKTPMVGVATAMVMLEGRLGGQWHERRASANEQLPRCLTRQSSAVWTTSTSSVVMSFSDANARLRAASRGLRCTWALIEQLGHEWRSSLVATRSCEYTQPCLQSAMPTIHHANNPPCQQSAMPTISCAIQLAIRVQYDERSNCLRPSLAQISIWIVCLPSGQLSLSFVSLWSPLSRFAWQCHAPTCTRRERSIASSVDACTLPSTFCDLRILSTWNAMSLNDTPDAFSTPQTNGHPDTFHLSASNRGNV